MTTTMSVFCLIESKSYDQKSGTEFGDAVFRLDSNSYEKFKYKVFYNTRKGPHAKQCNPFNENDIVHMVGKFTLIRIDGVETIALVLSSAYTFKRSEGGNLRKDLPEQAPVLAFHSRPVPNSHQLIDNVNCLKSTADVYNAYNNETTRLNFGIFYNVVKKRWSNIASQWNNDKLFHIMGHYAAAKHNFITVNATEIDFENINKSSNATSNLSSSSSSNPQYDIINRFYDSLSSDQSKEVTTSSQKVTTPNSIIPNPTSSTSNPSYNSHPQFPQPSNSTDSTFVPYSQLPYSMYNQTPYQNTATSQTTESTIVIENVSMQQSKKSPQKRGRKKNTMSKNKLPLKKVRTRSDTRGNQDSGIMNLALTSLSKNLEEDDESGDHSEDNMEV